MPTIDVTDAPDRLLGYQNILRSHCLMYVSRAIRNGEPVLNWAGLDTAWNCWQYNAGDKHTSRDVPRGFPAFLGTKRGDDDGDTFLSLGDGRFAATDHPWGEVGICTLAERETETGRKFVGWAGELFGYTLTSTTTAGSTGTRIEEDDMQTDEREALFAIKAALLDGRQPKLDVPAFTQTLDAATDVQNRLMAATGGQWDAFDELIRNTRSILALAGQKPDGTTDVDALAAAVRKGLGDELADSLAQRLTRPTDSFSH